MAERRMFAKTIIDSDAFLDMPLPTQALYFHLSMRADDDGFVNNPKKIQRVIGCCDNDLKLLVEKRFVIPFESGIVVIRHWKIHNYIQKDRYKETVYTEEKSQLMEADNKAYTLCIHDVHNSDTQDRLGKDRLVEDRQGEVSKSQDSEVQRKPEKKAESEAREDPGCETKFGNVLIAAASPDNPDTWPDPESPAPYSEPFYTDKAEANPHPEEPDNRTKRLYGQNKDVELTDRELAALDYYFPGYGLVYADKLSRYMKQTGKWWSRVKHYQLIRKWILSDKEKGALPALTENQQEEKSNELQSSARNGEQRNFSSWI